MESVCDATRVVTGSDRFVDALKALADFTALSRSSASSMSFREKEARITDLVSVVSTAAKADVLASYEPSTVEIEFEGRVYRRLPSADRGRYGSLSGVIEIDRHLYRDAGIRNGPTIVPLELMAGIVEGRWTPEAAEALGHLHQALPSREVAATCERLKVLHVSRASLERGGEGLGEAWEQRRVEAENHLVATMPIAEEAAAVAVSVDRVSVPMEEALDPAERKPDGPKIKVAYRQAYCATVTLYDSQGEPLETVRYGRMPEEGHAPLEDTLSGDISFIKGRRPDLRVVGLADGAAEMQHLLDRVLAEHGPEAVVIDFWHLIEKLSTAVSTTGRSPDKFLPDWKTSLLEDDSAIQRIRTTIRTWLGDYHEDDVPDGLYEAFTYLENNHQRMRYATLRRQGLPIGSGQVEATCKTLVSVRMKRAGSRWKHAGGQACLNLRALAQSTRWRAGVDFLLDSYRQHVTELQAA